MGYGHYTDRYGRDAGYYIRAYCDYDDCVVMIDRGFDYKCDQCDKFYCYDHQYYCCTEHRKICADCKADGWVCDEDEAFWEDALCQSSDSSSSSEETSERTETGSSSLETTSSERDEEGKRER